MELDSGTYQIKCVKVGGHTLTDYGQQAFAEDEVLDLLDQATPPAIRCASWGIAQNVCSDPSLESAQLIAAGQFEIVEVRQPMMVGV